MIRVTVELDVHGKGKVKRMLAVMVIANDGTGDEEYGNYTYALSHSGKYFYKKSVWKSGRITRFKRSKSPYTLIARCLKNAGFK